MTKAKGEEREAKSEEQKAEMMRTCEHIKSNRESSSQRSMLRMAASNGYEIFPGVEGVDVKKHGRGLIASRLAPALLSAVRGYGQARPFAIVANSASRPETQLIPAAPLDFGLPREQVVAVVFRKVALILDIQHGSHPSGIRCYYGRPCRGTYAVTQRTLARVGLPEVALLRFATARARLTLVTRLSNQPKWSKLAEIIHYCCDTFNFSRFMAGEVGNVCIPGGETCFPSIFSSLLGMRLDLWSLALCCPRRLLCASAQVANQDGPHAGVAVQQDLQVLVSQEGDLAAHVVEQTFHVVQIGAHLRQIVVRFARRWPRRGLRRSVCLTLPALSRRTELPASALCP